MDKVAEREIEEITTTLGLKGLRAYNTRIDRFEENDEYLLVGVYGPSDTKNFYKLPKDQLPLVLEGEDIVQYIDEDYPVVAVYQENSLVGIIKREEIGN